MAQVTAPILDSSLATDRIFMADGRFWSEASIEPDFGEIKCAARSEERFRLLLVTAAPLSEPRR